MIKTKNYTERRKSVVVNSSASDAYAREPFDSAAPVGDDDDSLSGEFNTPTVPELVAQANEHLGPDDCYPAKVQALLRQYDARWVETAIQATGAKQASNPWAYLLATLKGYAAEGGPAPAGRRGKAPAPAVATEGRALARMKSAGCIDCDGYGLATRYYHGEAPNGATHAVLYCRCAMGAWLHQSHQGPSETLRAVQGRISRLEDHPSLWRAPVAWSSVPDNPRCYPLSVWRDIESGANEVESLRQYTGTEPGSKPQLKKTKAA